MNNAKNNEGNPRQIKAFFLSPQWQQLKQAFDNMKMVHGLKSDYSIGINNDSTAVHMDFRLKDHLSKHKPSASSYTGLPPGEIIRRENTYLKKMQQDVVNNLKTMGLTSRTFYSIYYTQKMNPFCHASSATD